jgi:hypothetical protein
LKTVIKRIVIWKKINLTDIIKLKNFAGDYYHRKNELTIGAQIIDPILLLVKKQVDKLNVEWVKTDLLTAILS